MGTARQDAFTRKIEQKKKDEANAAQKMGRFEDGKNGCKRRRVVALACLLPAFVLYKM